MTSPLIDRLATEFNYPTLDAGTLETFLGGPGPRVLFITGDPAKLSHTNDVAVVLPEIVAASGGVMQAAVLDRDLEGAVMPAFGVLMLPALVFVRDGRYLGFLSRMQDWDVYLSKVGEFLQAEGEAMPKLELQSGTERRAGVS